MKSVSRNSWHLLGNHGCSNVHHLYKNFPVREGKLKVSANVNHAPFSTYQQGTHRPPLLPCPEDKMGSHTPHPFRHLTATSRAPTVHHFHHVTTTSRAAPPPSAPIPPCVCQPTTSRHHRTCPVTPSASKRQPKPPDALQATSHRCPILSHPRPYFALLLIPCPAVSHTTRLRPVLTPGPSLVSPTHPLLPLTRLPIGAGAKGVAEVSMGGKSLHVTRFLTQFFKL